MKMVYFCVSFRRWQRYSIRKTNKDVHEDIREYIRRWTSEWVRFTCTQRIIYKYVHTIVLDFHYSINQFHIRKIQIINAPRSDTHTHTHKIRFDSFHALCDTAWRTRIDWERDLKKWIEKRIAIITVIMLITMAPRRQRANKNNNNIEMKEMHTNKLQEIRFIGLSINLIVKFFVHYYVHLLYYRRWSQRQRIRALTV